MGEEVKKMTEKKTMAEQLERALAGLLALQQAVAGLGGLELHALSTEQLQKLRGAIAHEADELAYFVKQIDRELGYRE